MDEQKEKQVDEQVADTPEQRHDEERRAEQRSVSEDGLAPLFSDDATEKFRTRWLAIQSKFVDDPGDSVKQADDLVSDVIKNITQSFADRRGVMEKEWNGGGKASTEDLRLALKQYRSFFERLLSLQS